jgi:hypothetical protein
MGQLSDKVRSDLHREFFLEHKLLFIRDTPEYCRQCKQYVEDNARDRLIRYKREITGKDEDLTSSDFL